MTAFLEVRDLSVEFMTRRGRVQSRDALLSDVWGIDADVTTRTVDTHVSRLRGKLGPLLWQLPPSMPFDAARLDAFLGALPRDTGEALSMARRRDVELMRGRSALSIDRVRPLRHALEPRHHSFDCPEAVALLRRRARVRRASPCRWRG